MAYVVINCDGYYPMCGNCGAELHDGDSKCPECGKEINWDDKR